MSKRISCRTSNYRSNEQQTTELRTKDIFSKSGKTYIDSGIPYPLHTGFKVQNDLRDGSHRTMAPSSDIDAIKAIIDAFLEEVKQHGYQLPRNESTVGETIDHAEENGLPPLPVADGPNPRGLKLLHLTYRRPKTHGNKPLSGINGFKEGKEKTTSHRLREPTYEPVRISGRSEQRTSKMERLQRKPSSHGSSESPSTEWNKLGSSVYYFADDDRMVSRRL